MFLRCPATVLQGEEGATSLPLCCNPLCPATLPFPFFPFGGLASPRPFFGPEKNRLPTNPPVGGHLLGQNSMSNNPPHPRLEDRDNLSMGIRGQEGITFPPRELLPKHAGNCHPGSYFRRQLLGEEERNECCEMGWCVPVGDSPGWQVRLWGCFFLYMKAW